MSDFDDSEHLPDQAALGRYRPEAKSEAPALDPLFWRQLDLSNQKASELVDGLQQREAVVGLIKKDLAQKLQHFYLIYYVTFFLIVFLGALFFRLFPDFRQPEQLKFILAANGIYFSFLMIVSFFYELKQLIKWYFVLGTFTLLALSPLIYERGLIRIPLNTLGWSIAAIVTILFLTSFFSISHKGKSLKASILRIREKNSTENRKRTEFVDGIIEFLKIRGGKPRVRLRKWLIGYAAHTAYSVLTCSDCKQKKKALQEFKERYKFKDSMGRLATVVWIAGAIAYLFINKIPEIEAIPVAAASVLPAYSLSMLIMEQLDEERDKALAEMIELIK
jgi:hypothetical protein